MRVRIRVMSEAMWLSPLCVGQRWRSRQRRDSENGREREKETDECQNKCT